eukprot:TRINITY_DN7682_c0_g1_i3.p2 TRINITY_DN7682_c0_g1~~TRINITY_DN7682_c0_g1_i3.p2  ORF type:complete len:361 (+),score=119.82 TRINITY_DN7682_c0_g1_i3:531-1613(+)
MQEKESKAVEKKSAEENGEEGTSADPDSDSSRPVGLREDPIEPDKVVAPSLLASNEISSQSSSTPFKGKRYEYMNLCDPVVTLETNQKIETIQWDPSDYNRIAASFSSLRSIHMFDLEHCQVGTRPTITFDSSNGSGNFDFAFIPQSRGSIVGGGRDGIVRFWDVKTSFRPKKSIEMKAGSIHSLQVSPDGQLLYVAGEGKINAWDLRDTRTPLHQFSIMNLFTQSKFVPQNVEKIISCIRLDPEDQTLLSFQLEDGSCGLLDLAAKEIIGWKENPLESMDVDYKEQVRQTQLCYLPGSYLCSPSSDNCIEILDAGKFVPSNAEDLINVQIEAPSVSLDYRSDYLAVGMYNNNLSIVGMS